MARKANSVYFTPTLGGTTDWTISAAVQGYNTMALAGMVNGGTYDYRAESSDLSQWEIGEGVYNSGTGVLTRATVLYNSSGTGTATGQSGAGTKINFTTAPSVGVVELQKDIIAVDEANSFSTGQQDQARSNIAAAKVPTSWTRQVFLSGSGTYTTPSGCKAIRFRGVGGGGGGGGSGTSGSGGTGGTGGTTSLAAALTSISNASPAVLSLTNHGLRAGDSVSLITTGTLPTGLALLTTYYVLAVGLTANAFELSLTPGGAAINTSSAGSGTHSIAWQGVGGAPGSDGSSRADGGAGGGAFGGSINIQGTDGASAWVETITTVPGGHGGGSSFFGGGALGSNSAVGGTAARANTGGGGSGGAVGSGSCPGSGGGGGGSVEALIVNPIATYAYAVGAAGSAGAVGTSGNAGGAGGSGIAVMEEFY